MNFQQECKSKLPFLFISSLTLVILIVQFCDCKQTPEQLQDCLERASKLDKHFLNILVFGNRDFKAPQNESQMDEYCSISDNSLKVVIGYSKDCVPAFIRTVYSLVLSKARTIHNKRCKNKQGRKEFMDVISCPSPLNLEPGHKCMDFYIAQAEALKNEGAQSKKIDLCCCATHLFEDCITGAGDQYCAEKALKKDDRLVKYTLADLKAVNELFQLICGKYNSSPPCRQHYPNDMKFYEEVTANYTRGLIKLKNGSPLRPMLKLFLEDELVSNKPKGISNLFKINIKV